MVSIDRRHRQATSEGRICYLQTWGHLLFVHAPIPPDFLRPLVHPDLEIDCAARPGGKTVAWVGLVGLVISRSRPAPQLPLGLRWPEWPAFSELNVRTYVRGPQGEPAVWFLSIDVCSLLVSQFARLTYKVPYLRSATNSEVIGNRVHYSSTRAPSVSTEISAQIVDEFRCAAAGSLEHFFVVRYRLYASNRGQLVTARVRHEPYSLAEAEIVECRSSHPQALGLPELTWEHACYCRGVPVEFDELVKA